MDKLTIFKILFKPDINGEPKFNEFSQLTSAGRTLVYLVVNLALGGNCESISSFILRFIKRTQTGQTCDAFILT